MQELHEFLTRFYEKLHHLEELLKKIVREEELLEENILVKSGFLIRRYSLRIDAIKKETLLALKQELQMVSTVEAEMQYQAKTLQKSLLQIEKAYAVYKKQKFPLTTIFVQYMNNAFSLAKGAVVRIDEILQLLESGVELHKKGKEVHTSLTSLEKMTNQIVRFMTLLRQVIEKSVEFEKESYYPSPRMYGRVMSDREFKQMKETGELSSRQDPTPVFDCPKNVRDSIFSMSRDKRAEFFRAVGVRSIHVLVLFQTALKPVVGPVPQSNGLREYKFPKGIPVQILEVAA